LNEVDSLADLVGKLPGIEAEGIYTHFACADEPGSTTAAQLAGFRGALQRLQAAGHSFRLIHASNSAGTLWVSDAPCNVVRAGIAMYGYSPNPSRPSPVPLRPALSLLSTVARLTSIAPGTGVGYGHAFRAGRPSRIALVPIGYGDGLHRALGNGVGSVLIRETRAPIVGRISMDQITVDVTDVRGVRAGDDVTIIGRQGAVAQSADDVAAALGTISYEVLTALLRRVPRLYVSGEQILAARTLADLAHEIPDAAGG
jgi:alanine racemase